MTPDPCYVWHTDRGITVGPFDDESAAQDWARSRRLNGSDFYVMSGPLPGYELRAPEDV